MHHITMNKKMLFLFTFVSCVSALEYYPPIIIDLNDEPPGLIQTQFYNISEPKYTINLIHVNPNVTFGVVQLHTYMENLTLAYADPISTFSFVSGNNIGLVWTRDMIKYATTTKDINVEGKVVMFYLSQWNNNVGNVTVLISVSTYGDGDPMPGGCNLSFNTAVAPYQQVLLSDEVITVTSQPPSLPGTPCDIDDQLTTDMYYLYLDEYANSTQEYFDGLQKMISVENITKYGRKVPQGLAINKYKQIYSRYSGVGRIFAVVATTNGSRTSAYVPTASFGCNIYAWEEDCVGLVGIHWKLTVAMLFICGILLCFGGHRFFKTSLVISSYTFMVLLMLICVSLDDDFTTEGKTIFAFSMGLILGPGWFYFCLRIGRPVLHVQFTFLIAGFIVASIIFYSQLGGFNVFSDDSFFWTFFALVVLMVAEFPVLFLRPFYHIVALSLFGSYAVVVALNYYVGGNLSYIVINTFRRITVKGFGDAVLDPPYQLSDLSQTFFWMVLFGVGIYVQHRHSIGKPPFPPSRSVASQEPDERTPLVYPELPPPYWP